MSKFIKQNYAQGMCGVCGLWYQAENPKESHIVIPEHEAPLLLQQFSFAPQQQEIRDNNGMCSGSLTSPIQMRAKERFYIGEWTN